MATTRTVVVAAAAVGALIAVGVGARKKPRPGHRETGICRFSLPDGGVEVLNLDDADPRSCVNAAIERASRGGG